MKKLFAIANIIFFFTGAHYASADAWWGKGYQTKEWVLRHGGTIIYYNIRGGNDKSYKAVMTRDGQYVEVEFGQNGVFDDAKDGTYLVTFYRCGKGCADQKFDRKEKIRSRDKAFASTVVGARGGQTVRLSVDKNGGPVSRSGGSVVPLKPRKTAVQLEDEAALEHEGKACTNPAQEHDKRLTQFLLPRSEKRSVYSDRLARELGVLPHYDNSDVVQELAEEKKTEEHVVQ